MSSSSVIPLDQTQKSVATGTWRNGIVDSAKDRTHHCRVPEMTGARHRVWERLQVLAMTILCLAGATVPDVAFPQQEFYSYYDRSTAAVRRLRNVEGHHMGKAVEHLEAERWDLSIRECDFMLRYFPDHPRALYLMAVASVKAKTPERAEPYFHVALNLFPESATTNGVYGIFLHKRGKLGAAIKAYQASLALDPRSAETHYNLGLSYTERGQYELANRHAQAAYSLGYPLPGLRDKLRSVGQWSSLPDTVLTRLTTRAEADASQ